MENPMEKEKPKLDMAHELEKFHTKLEASAARERETQDQVEALTGIVTQSNSEINDLKSEIGSLKDLLSQALKELDD